MPEPTPRAVPSAALLTSSSRQGTGTVTVTDPTCRRDSASSKQRPALFGKLRSAFSSKTPAAPSPAVLAVKPPKGAAEPPRPATPDSVATHQNLQKQPSNKQSPKPKSRRSTNTSDHLPAFVELPGGQHEHHLRPSYRPEGITGRFRSLLGKKSQRDDGPKDLDSKTGASEADRRYGYRKETLGSGAFGVVKLSHRPIGGGAEQLFAVKEYRRLPSETEDQLADRAADEYSIMSSLGRHPGVVHALDLLRDPGGGHALVTEFCAGGDVHGLVDARNRLEAPEADCLFKQLLRGVDHLHRSGVVHLDLKPENLLLTARGGLKITDFGNAERFATEEDAKTGLVSGMCGSTPYIAPEVYAKGDYDGRAVDVWACGIIYMAMRMGSFMWRSAAGDDEYYLRYLVDRCRSEGFEPFEALQTAACRNVVYCLLDPVPNRRITANQAVRTEWIRGVQLCEAAELECCD